MMAPKGSCEAVAEALRKFVADHGADNSVSPGELSALYCRLSARTIGLVLTAERFALNRLLERYGFQVTGYVKAHGRSAISIGPLHS